MVQQCVILAGGYGTRLGYFTKKTPKPLIKISQNFTFIDYLINFLKHQGFKKFLILSHYRNEKFINHFKNSKENTKIIFEKKKLGTGGAIKHAYKYLDSEFIVINGDTIFDINIRDLIFNAKKCKSECFVALLETNKHQGKYSYNLKGNRVSKFLISYKKKSLVSGGIYFFKKKIFNDFSNNILDLDHDIVSKVFKKKKLYAKIYESKFIDIGTPEDLKRANKIIKSIIKKPVCFLDRDGVINKDTGYVATKKRFIWNKGVKKAIRFLNNNNYYVVVVTNQAGVARGFYKEKDVILLHNWINNELYRYGAYITKFYFSPFHQHGVVKKYKKKSIMRKPSPGMLLKAEKDLFILKTKSFLIGDKYSDLKAGKKFGIRSFLVTKNLHNQVRNIVEMN